jgi:antitoxin CcdA
MRMILAGAAAMKATYNRNAPKRAINLSLNGDLVRQARQYSGNLSAEVEALLAGYVQQQTQAREDKLAEARRLCEALNEFNRQHGGFADEHSTL